jgi:hypothetical protein
MFVASVVEMLYYPALLALEVRVGLFKEGMKHLKMPLKFQIFKRSQRPLEK